MESCGSSSSSSSSFILPELPANVQSKVHSICRAGGFASLQVIADFDRTLTKYTVNGTRAPSSHSIVRQSNAVYDLKRQELFEHYYPLEISPDIPLCKKCKLMEEWWEKTHILLVEGGLTQEDIIESVANSAIEFRDGVDELFQILQKTRSKTTLYHLLREENSVPVLIFSAGISNIIEEVMNQKLCRKYTNVRIVSNRMEFNANGDLQGFIGKTIHVLNKNEHALGLSNHVSGNVGPDAVEDVNLSDLKIRKNVLLLGDHIADLGMSDGLDYENRITIGFLNDHVDAWVEEYKKSFDIVLMVKEKFQTFQRLDSVLFYRNDLFVFPE